MRQPVALITRQLSWSGGMMFRWLLTHGQAHACRSPTASMNVPRHRARRSSSLLSRVNRRRARAGKSAT